MYIEVPADVVANEIDNTNKTQSSGNSHPNAPKGSGHKRNKTKTAHRAKRQRRKGGIERLRQIYKEDCRHK